MRPLRTGPALGTIAGLSAAMGLVAGCATEINGPAKLPGERLDAAVALYGPWAEQLPATRAGKREYIWRRAVQASNGDFFCELHVILGFHDTIAQAYTVGIPEACKLYQVRLVPSDKS